MSFRNLGPILIVLFSFSLGYKLSYYSFNGKATARLYISGRVVAQSQQPIKQPLLLDARLLRVENIIESMSVVRDESLGVIGLQFGNYITQFGQNLCSAFQTVEIILFGDGVATSGEHPKMIFSGYCPTDDRANSQNLNLRVNQVFPLFLISDCISNVRMEDQMQLSNGTNVRVVNMDVGLNEPDWVIEKISFIDDNNPLNTIEFTFRDIEGILNKSNSRSQTNIQNARIALSCY